MNTASMHKTVLITGASGSLGTAVTRHFLDKGYQVIATVHKDLESPLPGGHANLEVKTVNLADEAETGTFIQSSIRSNGKIDAALLLAGGYAMGTIAATKAEDLKKQISLNFETAYHVARPLLEHMLENNGGRMVFIGGRPALHPPAGKTSVAYGLSKSLLFKLAEFINEEGKGKNVMAAVVVTSTLDT